jgi:chloride channel protein, CIC family
MSDEPHVSDGDDLIPLAILSLLVGIAAGLVGALFQVCLNQANDFRNEFVHWSQGIPVIGAMLVVMLCATATGIAAWLVRRFAPRASGSGIPHTEAVLDATVPPAPVSLIPVKLVGGVLAIGSGLALGREGPSVQIGASLGHLIGRIARRPWADCRVLIAAGAGAGLATAFNAPIAGAVFVLEELVRRFETRIAIAALGASATAMAVARIFLGDTPQFHLPPIPYPGPLANALFLALGVVAGVLAVAYNRAILAALGMVDGFKRRPIEVRAAIIGGIVGLIAWFAPDVVGGGESLTQQTLDAPPLIGALVAVFLLRFILGPLSYATATPGGLFAPLLVLGTQIGLLFFALCHAFADLQTPANAFAIVGMAAFFTGVVRAPVTGIVLIIEMTGSFTMLLPMLGACFTAMLIPTLLSNPPVYTSLSLLDARNESSAASAKE